MIHTGGTHRTPFLAIMTCTYHTCQGALGGQGKAGRGAYISSKLQQAADARVSVRLHSVLNRVRGLDGLPRYSAFQRRVTVARVHTRPYRVARVTEL